MSKDVKEPEVDLHRLRRFMIGNPASAALEADKGKKTDAFADAFKHQLAETWKGRSVGAAGGAATGGLLGWNMPAQHRGSGTKGQTAALIGTGLGLLGAGVGGLFGKLKGKLDEEADAIHQRYSSQKQAFYNLGVQHALVKLGAITPAAKESLKLLFKAKPETQKWLQQTAQKGGFKFQHPSIEKFQQSQRTLRT